MNCLLSLIGMIKPVLLSFWGVCETSVMSAMSYDNNSRITCCYHQFFMKYVPLIPATSFVRLTKCEILCITLETYVC